MKYKAKPGVILTQICCNHFLVTVDECIKINETAAFCWTVLQNGCNDEELLNALCEIYDIHEINTIRSDLVELIDALVEKQLVVRLTCE